MRRSLLIIGIILSLVAWHWRLRFPFDDVFISFRYAAHVASGYGFVWNIGGPHTEGFTNFLFILLLAVAHPLTPHLLAVAQVIGLISTVASGLIIFSIASRLRGRVTGLLAVSFFWITPLTWINALSGMETSLFILLCVLALWLAEREQFYYAFIAGFFAALARPEGALMGAVVFVAAATRSWQRGDGGSAKSKTLQCIRALGWPFVVGFTLPILLYIGWTSWYFGNPLPNSFYVKVANLSGITFPGLQYVRLFAMSIGALIALTFGIRRWKHSILLPACLWIMALLAFYVFVLPLEGLYDRFLWPAFAVLCITAAVGARDISAWKNLRPFSVVAGIFVIIQFLLSILTPRTRQAFAAHEDVWEASMDPIVRALQQLPDADSLHCAYGDAGYVVYQSNIHHIDLFGLNDTRIAHSHSRTERAAIVRSERPDLLLLPVYPLDSCEEWVEDAYGLAQTKEFQPVASTAAFPFRIVWVLNTASPYYADCKRALLSRIGVPGSELEPAPTICYSTR